MILRLKKVIELIDLETVFSSWAPKRCPLLFQAAGAPDSQTLSPDNHFLMIQALYLFPTKFLNLKTKTNIFMCVVFMCILEKYLQGNITKC